MHLRGWIEPLLRDFGNQKRRAITGIRHLRGGGTHEDGWPTISAAAFAKEGGITLAAGAPQARGLYYGEVYTKEALEIWRIYEQLPYDMREIIFAHFVATEDAPAKARELGISVRSYWDRLKNVYSFVAGYLMAAGIKPPSGAPKTVCTPETQ
ncbi:MAG TPA: hypothetical protein VGF89_01040 [Steroidobacteraceae bacterium]|jgi:hypothetical protein